MPSSSSISTNGGNKAGSRQRKRSTSSQSFCLLATLESSNDGLVALDADGKIAFFNHRLAELLKLPGKLENQTRIELIDAIASQAKNPDAFLRRMNEQGSMPRAESTAMIELKDGRRLEHFVKPQWVDDAFACVIFRFRDATERMRAQEALLESQALYQSLVDEMPAGVFRKDREGRYVFVNSWFCRLKHLGPERFLGKSTIQVAAEEEALRPDRKQDIDDLSHRGTSDHETILATGKTIHAEEYYPAEDGKDELFLHTVKCPVLGSDGTVIGSQGILTDITQRKRAERELENAHRTASSVLHNVGNVLNSINVSMSLVADVVSRSRLGNLARVSELIQSHRQDLANFLTNDPKGKQLPDYIASLAEFLNQEQANLVKEVSEAGKHVQHVKEIVTAQQSYTKSFGITEKVSVVELVEDALRLNAGALTRHQIKVEREFPSEAPKITVERHKVLQILVNLIKNAKEACDESPQEEKVLKVRVGSRDNHVDLAVIDNGVGILPENLGRIFNHGFTTRKEGHGFGLHSGALAAKQLGGSLTVHSDGPGKGAAFLLQLPFRPPAVTLQ
jgi:PAS domain S-box-containing protein